MLATLNCFNDCRVCPHYPDSRQCQILIGEPGRWAHEAGTVYWRDGACNRCGLCCPDCSRLRWQGETAVCSAWPDWRDACRDYPTIEQLYEPASVPEACSFGVMARFADGTVRRLR